MVLADNVDGGDDLDLIITTMNGNVFCFSTPSPHHSLKVGVFNSYWHGRRNLSLPTNCALPIANFYPSIICFKETI